VFDRSEQLPEYIPAWITLTEAMERVPQCEDEEDAWTQICNAITDKALSARGLLDGTDGPLLGEWLVVQAFGKPEGDIIWFDIEKWFESDDQRQSTPTPPQLAERIEVDRNKFDKLWPQNIDANYSKAAEPEQLAAPKRRGRKPGDGSMAKLDAPYIKKMKVLLDEGKARSANNAALKVVEKFGSQIEGSSATQKQDRLARRYRAEFN
jgi:hypothetical protein